MGDVLSIIELYCLILTPDSQKKPVKPITMSHFRYKFLGKTPELIAQRRVTLDWYANLAQISQLIVHLIIPFCNLIASVLVRKLAGKSRQKANEAVLARTARSLKFKLDTKVVKGYGTYGQWIFGLA